MAAGKISVLTLFPPVQNLLDSFPGGRCVEQELAEAGEERLVGVYTSTFFKAAALEKPHRSTRQPRSSRVPTPVRRAHPWPWLLVCWLDRPLGSSGPCAGITYLFSYLPLSRKELLWNITS